MILRPELVEAIASVIAAKLHRLLPERGSEEQWRLWNVEETSRSLGRSVRWVRERAKRGELPHVKLDGGALAFDPKDVRAFAASRRVPLDPRRGAA